MPFFYFFFWWGMNHIGHARHVPPRQQTNFLSLSWLCFYILARYKLTSDPLAAQYTAYQKINSQDKQEKSLIQGLGRAISKWASHHIWHLFLQVTTLAAWIMGAAVPSASPSQEGECAPALTTSSWRRTMSPVQVGGNNESDGCAGGWRSLCPSTPSCPRPSSCGKDIIGEPYLFECKFPLRYEK